MTAVSKRTVICIASPLPPPTSGMSLSGEKLIGNLQANGFAVRALSATPVLPGPFAALPGVRTLLRGAVYFVNLLFKLPGAKVVHYNAASGRYFFLSYAPLLALAHILRCRVAVNYHGGNAEAFLTNSGKLAIPMLQCADAIVVPSEFLVRVFAKFGMKALVWPNPADLELFPFHERKEFKPRLLITRHLQPIYNVAGVIRVFHKVQSTFPEAALGIVGIGRERAKLEKLVVDLQLRNVTFYGHVPHHELPKIYEQYDFLVNTSLVDNFPGALMEAACCGLVIASYASGGIPDMIHDNETGVLVLPGDEGGLAQAILNLLSDQSAARRLTAQARRWAQQYSWPMLLPRLLQIYGLRNQHDGNQDTRDVNALQRVS